MQKVALAESWDRARETDLLQQALAFQPDYYYYYRGYANYLKPQWSGEEGEAERFAAEAADRVGGIQGDILYFQIAVELICHCGVEPGLKQLSWPRIQKGVAELEKQYGESHLNLNLLAYMAIKETDSLTARNTFLRIGDDWNEDTWRTRKNYESYRDWANKRAEYEDAPSTRIIRQAREKFAVAIQQCAQIPGADVTPFSLLIHLEKDGVVESASPHPENQCGYMIGETEGRDAFRSVPYTLHIQD